MTQGDSLSILWYLLALVLVGSALMNHRISLRSGFGMMLVWIGIFAALAIVYTQRDAIWRMIEWPLQSSNAIDDAATENASSAISVPGAARPTVRVPLGRGGHYWIDATINGSTASFLIDSGATVTVVSKAFALSSGLNIDNTGPVVRLQTATGEATAHRARVARLALGSIALNDVDVLVMDTASDTNVIGMNILSQLHGWRVENGVMILER